MAVDPRAPAPYTTARVPGRGGLRVIAWNDTDHGSARTASSSSMSSGTATAIDSCAGSRSAKPPVASTALPVWMPTDSRAHVEVAADRVVAPRAGRAQRADAAGPATEVGVQHDPLPRLDAAHGRPRLLDGGDDLVPQHLGERDEGGHHVVGGVLEVHEHLLGVRPADAGHPGAQHQPVVAQQPRFGQVDQRHRRRRQVAQQARSVVGQRLGPRLRIGEELERPQRALLQAGEVVDGALHEGVDVRGLELGDGLEVGHVALEPVADQ